MERDFRRAVVLIRLYRSQAVDAPDSKKVKTLEMARSTQCSRSLMYLVVVNVETDVRCPWGGPMTVLGEDQVEPCLMPA
jgi:hypothetical protein